MAAAAGGDLAALTAVLDPRATLTSDGGGEVIAARRQVRGAEAVAQFVLRTAARIRPAETVLPVQVNGQPGLAVLDGGRVRLVVALTVDGPRITRIDLVLAPAKLAGCVVPGGPGDAAGG
jgi:RNA polymerase sigma-70 factor (ECF subfamily)